MYVLSAISDRSLISLRFLSDPSLTGGVGGWVGGEDKPERVRVLSYLCALIRVHAVARVHALTRVHAVTRFHALTRVPALTKVHSVHSTIPRILHKLSLTHLNQYSAEFSLHKRMVVKGVRTIRQTTD